MESINKNYIISISNVTSKIFFAAVLFKKIFVCSALLTQVTVLSSVCICVPYFISLLVYFAKWKKGTQARYIVKKVEKGPSPKMLLSINRNYLFFCGILPYF